MRVIVQKSFGRHSVGDTIPEMPAAQARSLIARGLVAEAEKEEAFTSPADRKQRKMVRK